MRASDKKLIIGLLMVASGIGLGIYVGGYLMFVGGIIQFIESVHPINAVGIGWGIGRIIGSAFAGWLTAMILIVPGLVLLQD